MGTIVNPVHILWKKLRVIGWKMPVRSTGTARGQADTGALEDQEVKKGKDTREEECSHRAGSSNPCRAECSGRPTSPSLPDGMHTHDRFCLLLGIEQVNGPILPFHWQTHTEG